MADALASGASGLFAHAGSTPVLGIINRQIYPPELYAKAGAQRSGRCGLYALVGSTPTVGTSSEGKIFLGNFKIQWSTWIKEKLNRPNI